MRRRGFLNGMTMAGAGLIAGGAGRRLAGAAAPAPRARAGTPRPPTLAALLEPLRGTMSARVTRFEHSAVAAELDVALPLSGPPARLRVEGAELSCRLQVSPVRDTADVCDLLVVFRCERGRVPNAAVSVVLTIDRWSRDGYLLIPGAVYGGNRFASRRIAFPPLLSEPSDIGPHVPPIVSDIPRLNILAGDSHLMLRAADMAAPTVGLRVPGAEPDTGAGLLLLAEPTAEPGMTGLRVAEDGERTALTLAWSAPAVRPETRYALCNGRAPSSDRGTDIGHGFVATFRLRLASFPCPTVQTLFDRAFDARRDRVGAMTLRHELPLSAARQLISERRSHDTEPLEARFSTGAGGALALVLPLAATGTEDARRRAMRVLDLQLRGQAASGFLRACSNGTQWWDEGDTAPVAAPKGDNKADKKKTDAKSARARRWVHVGRHAEALHLGCRLALLLGRIDTTFALPDGWHTGLSRAADAVIRVWKRHKQLGQYVAADTGELAVGGSTAGALVPAALALTARVLENPAYGDFATVIAEELHTRFVRAGMTMGGAPAALQCPDSRSAAQLLESFVTLADATGDTAWVDRAAEVAHQVATWVVLCNAELPAISALGRMGVRTAGAVLTNVQDKWALPSFAGLSGESLLRLYRATGRVAYLELLRETVHNSTGYVATATRRPDADTPLGWVAPAICVGDAAGLPGEIPAAAANATIAAEAACLLAASEIPSIYVQPDTGFVFTFDHVDVRITERTAAHLRLSIRNPTAAEAELRILSEASRDRARPLDLFPLWGARTLTLAAGAAEQLELPVAAT